MHKMNGDLIQAAEPASPGIILDVFPILFNLKFLMSDIHKHLDETAKSCQQFFQRKIDEAKVK